MEKYLRTAPLCAPAYLILSGRDRGTILTRSSAATLHAAELAADSKVWHIQQDNTDPWQDPRPGDARAKLAARTLDALGREKAATVDGVWATMSTRGNATQKGVLNEDTVYSAVFVPGDPSGVYRDVIRDI